MPRLPTDRGIFLTPRYSQANAEIEVIFTVTEVTPSFLVEGRMSGASTSSNRGYFYYLADGQLRHNYGGTVTLTNLLTGETMSRVAANIPSRLLITGIAAGMRLCMIGIAYDYRYTMTGKIHAFRASNWHMGFERTATDSDLGGLHGNVLLQFDRITQLTSPPNSDFIVNQQTGYTPTNVTPMAHSGWTDNGDGSFTNDSSATLAIGASANAVDATRRYPRFMNVSFDVALNGATGDIEWFRPAATDPSTMPMVEGHNETKLFINLNTRVTLQFSNISGVTVSNIVVNESQDALLQGITWTEKIA